MRNSNTNDKSAPLNELNNILESTKTKRSNNLMKINVLDKDIENIERLIKKFTADNLDFEKKF